MFTATIRTATLALAAGGLTLAAPASALPTTHAAPAAQTAVYGDMATGYDRDHRRWDRRDHRDRYSRYDRGGYGEAVNRNTRVWRGNDGRVYCRKSDGTTGLIIGGAAGALLGREIAGRGDRTLGAILGAAGGALLGKQIDSGTKCN